MSGVSVYDVDKDLKEVTLKVGGVFLVFQKTKNGKMRCISKYTYDGNNLNVPKAFFLKAVKTAAAVISEIERRS